MNGGLLRVHSTHKRTARQLGSGVSVLLGARTRRLQRIYNYRLTKSRGRLTTFQGTGIFKPENVPLPVPFPEMMFCSKSILGHSAVICVQPENAQGALSLCLKLGHLPLVPCSLAQHPSMPKSS